jgi:hypothetical protein
VACGRGCIRRDRDADEVTSALNEPTVRLYLEVIAAAATGRCPHPNEWL